MTRKKVSLLIMFTLLLSSCAFLFSCGGSLADVSKTLNTYTMELNYNHTDKTVAGIETLNYKNKTGTSLNYIMFHLYPKAFASGAVNAPVSALNINKAYPNGPSYGNIEVSDVKVNGQTATFTYEGEDKNILKVNFETPLNNDQTAEIQITFAVVIPNVNHRFGYGENTVNLGNIYPVACVFEQGEFITDPYHYNGDPFYSDLSNYNVTLKAPSNIVVAATGNQTVAEDKLGVKTHEISAIGVRDFAMVLSTKFQLLSGTAGETTVNYFYYEDDNAADSLQAGIDAINTFNTLFGEYPYEVFNVVKANFLHGGMEYPQLVYISDTIDRQEDYINTIIHETAHQWWYGVVGNNAYRHSWLDEGLTEFATLMFYEENLQYNISLEEAVKNATNSYVTFVDLYTNILGSVDTTMHRALNEYDTEPEYVYMTYVKGMLFFDGLRTAVGRANFTKAMQKYYETYKYKNVTPEDLLSVFEDVCKRDLKSFFDSWIDGKVIIQSF